MSWEAVGEAAVAVEAVVERLVHQSGGIGRNGRKRHREEDEGALRYETGFFFVISNDIIHEGGGL